MSEWFQEVADKEVPFSEIESRRDEFLEWDFEPMFEEKCTGYEEFYSFFNSCTPAKYDRLTDAGKKSLEDKIAEIYLEEGIFPISYYSDLGAENAILKALNYEVAFKENVIKAGAGVGSGVCNWLFPNLFKAYSINDSAPEGLKSVYDKFYNEEYLRAAIRFSMTYGKTTPSPSSILAALRQRGSSPTNFRPMNAKGIYERFTPEGGVIYDFAAGFGGRMMGALTSKKNFTYVAVDPNTETQFNLHKLQDFLSNAITLGEPIDERVGLHCIGSEDFRGPEESIDFAFASPPYWDLEIYSDEETQSVERFPALEEWLEGFVRGTIRNIVHMLKKGHHYAVNIADFETNGRPVHYTDEWCRISAEEGAPLMDTVFLGVNARAGSKQQKLGEIKKENIFIFRKN